MTVVKCIAEFRWKCPKCGFEERYEPDDYDIEQLFGGTFSSQCWECGETVALFYEDEL
ncbi:MAG: hypothetical protein IJ087_01560 [Eggerthellaceae bacterium]|nr:hypothetical protein [Eggerthellaceae bacterium]